jgi:spore coat protein U-like protein
MIGKGWLVLLLLLVSPTLKAVCTVTVGNAVFGSQSSFTVSSTEQQVTANLVVTCDTILNLLTNDSIILNYTAGGNSANNRATLKRTDNTAITDAVPVRLCTQATCSNSTETTVAQSYTWGGNTLLGLLNAKQYTIPIWFRTVGGQSVTAGPYHSTMSFNIAYNVCAVGVAGLCLTPQTGNINVTAQLDMTVTNDCITITAPDVNFGSAPLVKNFPTLSQTISITCTKGSSYTVGINNGQNAVGSVRNMASGANRLSYDIYKASTGSRWGSTGTDRWSSATSTSISSDGLLRTYNYTAQVLSGQNTPPAGTYSDTLVVDVAF